MSLWGCLQTPVPRGIPDGVDATVGDDTVDDVADTGNDDEVVAPDTVTTPDVVGPDATDDTTVGPSNLLALGWSAQEQTARIENVNFALTFNSNLGWTPSSWRLKTAGGDRELLYTASTSHERGMGLLLYEPTESEAEIHASWQDASPGGLIEVQSGPALVHVSRGWSLRNGTMTGTTDYVVHADGRIHVFHTAVLASAVPDGWLVSFVAVPTGALTHVKAGPEAPMALAGQEVDGFSYRFLAENRADHPTWPMICASSNTEPSLALALVPQGGNSNWPHGRITLSAEGADTAHSVRLQYDLARHDVPEGTWNLATMLVARPDAGCSPEFGVFSARYRFPPTLSLGPRTALVTDDPGDPDGRGFAKRTGYFVLSTNDRSAQFQLSEPTPSFTVSIQSPSATMPVTVTRGSVTLTEGSDFLAQPTGAGPNGLFLVFLTPTNLDDNIVVSW